MVGAEGEPADVGAAALDRDRPAQSGWERTFVHLALGVVALFAGQCLSVALGHHQPVLAWALAGALVALLTTTAAWMIALTASRLQPALGCSRSAAHLLTLLAAVAALGLVVSRYSHRTEPVLAYDDQATYALAAAHMVQHGHLAVDLPILARIPQRFQHLLTIDQRYMALSGDGAAPHGQQFVWGFFRNRADGRTLLPTFPLGYLLLLGPGYQVGGWCGLSLVDPLLSLASALLLGLLVGRWLGTLAGAGACALFLVNPLTQWAANTCFAEPALGFVWLAALLAWECRAAGSARSALAAALLCIVATTIKIDALLLAPLPIIIGILAWRHRAQDGMMVVSAAVVGLGAVAALWLTDYSGYLFGNLLALAPTPSPWVAAEVLAALLVLALSIRLAARRSWDRQRLATVVRWSAALVFIGLVIYGWAIRPSTTAPDHFYFWPMQSEIASYREQTLPRIGWYLGRADPAQRRAPCARSLSGPGAPLARPWRRSQPWSGGDEVDHDEARVLAHECLAQRDEA